MEINNKNVYRHNYLNHVNISGQRLEEKKAEMLTVVIFMCKDFECVFCILLTW